MQCIDDTIVLSYKYIVHADAAATFREISLGQIFCSRGRPLENSRGRPVDFTGRPVNSTGRPLEFSRGRPVKFFIAFLDEIGNSKSFEANLQNSSGRPVGFLEDVQ